MAQCCVIQPINYGPFPLVKARSLLFEGVYYQLSMRILTVVNDSAIITPHVSDVSGVICLTSSVCVCVCLCVCVLPLSRPNGQTDLNFGMKVKWKDI